MNEIEITARPPAPRFPGPGGEAANRAAGSAAELLRAREDHLPLVRELLKEGLAVRLRVRGRSMVPYVVDGDLITLRSVVSRAIRLGDLVFSQEPGLPPLLHRVVSRRCEPDDSWVIRTKGDAVRRPDAPVRGEHVVGKVAVIRRELPLGEHVEFHLGAQRRNLDLMIALASRFTPRLFAAFSRRLVPVLGTMSFRARRAPVVAWARRRGEPARANDRA